MFALKPILPALLFLLQTRDIFAATCEPGSAFACTFGDGALGRTEDKQAAREDYCGNNLWQTSSCYRYQDGPAPAIYIQNSQPGANTQQDCFDALQSIIDDCSGDLPGSAFEAFGTYDVHGQEYRLGACSNAFVCDPN